MGSIHVILNASAGAGHDAGAAQRIVDAFRAAGVEADVTAAPRGSIAQAARAALARSPQMVVAAGGDGTVSAVAAELVGGDVPLGVLPMGTLNHFARELGMPLELDAAARALAGGRVARIDVGEIDGRVFLNNASLGIYPEFVRDREARERRGWSRVLAALTAFLRTLFRYPSLRVDLEIDGEGEVHGQSRHACRTPFVLIGNNAYAWEGLSAGERPRLDAGRLAVYCGHRLGRLATLGLVARAFLGRLRPDADFYTRSAGTVRLATRPVRVALATDGEVVDVRAPLTCRIRPRALAVVVPADGDRA